jgi:WD40 repeat protein
MYSSFHTLEVHDIASRRLIRAFPSDTQFDFVSRPVAFAHDGFAIVTGGQGKAFIWDIENGDELQVLNHGGKQMNLVRFLLTAFDSGSCRISTLTVR